MQVLCLKCSAPIELAPGPGRPPRYCGVTCKRLVEYEVRRLDKRIAAYELELRGLQFDGPDLVDNAQRQKRMRALRGWIRTDQERLRVLLNGGRSDGVGAQCGAGGGAP
ncbi:MAG: hypothetical protein JNL30_01110 [Rubrivivax sp.]|nr:hypothetical protein [Rubrivivax sp.]